MFQRHTGSYVMHMSVKNEKIILFFNRQTKVQFFSISGMQFLKFFMTGWPTLLITVKTKKIYSKIEMVFCWLACSFFGQVKKLT